MNLKESPNWAVFFRRYGIEYESLGYEDIHIGTLHVEEDEFGNISELQIEPFSSDEKLLLEDELQEFDEDHPEYEALVPYFFRWNAKKKLVEASDVHKFPEEFFSASFPTKRARLDDDDEDDSPLFWKILRNSHGLLSQVRRGEPIFIVGRPGPRRGPPGKRRLEPTEDKVHTFCRVKISSVDANTLPRTVPTFLTFDLRCKSDGFLINRDATFGMAQFGNSAVPIMLRPDGGIVSGGPRSLRELGWTNLHGRRINEREGLCIWWNGDHLATHYRVSSLTDKCGIETATSGEAGE